MSGEKQLRGQYANYFKVGHNAFEFVIDFGQHEGTEVVWNTRVITNPSAARALLDLLRRSVEQHERKVNVLDSQ